MPTLSSLLTSREPQIHINRAGLATRCRLAGQALSQGRSVMLVTLNGEEFSTARALLSLFTPELSHGDASPARPSFANPCLALPPHAKGGGRAVRASRLPALYGLALGQPRCVVADISSLVARCMPLSFFMTKTLKLRRGDEFSPQLVLEQAAEWGYERVSLVNSTGDMAMRGDIFDIYPTGYARPLRLEFFGDTLEEIRLFDAESQRSLLPLEEATLLPANPLALNRVETETARQRCDRLFSEGRISENDCYSFKKALDGGGGGLLPGCVFDDHSDLEDWLDRETLWLLPGEADSGQALHDAHLAMKEILESEQSLLPQPASLALRKRSQPAPWRDFQQIFAEPLVTGIEARGHSLAERPIRAYSDLFPLPGAQDRPWQHLTAGLKEWPQKHRQVVLSFSSERSRAKFLNLAAQDGIAPALRYAPDIHGLFALVSPFRSGAELVWDNTLILGEDILQPRAEKTPRAASRAFKGLRSFETLADGALLVHRDYGIGRFAGLHHLEINEAANDFLLIEYSGKDKLYVPADRIGLIQRFRGPEGVEPPLDRLGGAGWIAGREKARKAIEKIAADLVEMYAWRKVVKGWRYGPPDALYNEFESTFGFEETPDQARAIAEVLADMEKPEPMDRLVCGDVGFGKTEVALRAAFRAVAEGRQVAMLCPTTVLAEQHYQTFRARLSGFPVYVGLLSRFVSSVRQKETIAAAAAGRIDILIGTHRLLSNDVKLPNLALLVLDEEQRFGVRHKEKLKSLKKNVDVLTLTATPIPRTLQLSISGIRELSVIETAPLERKPVATAVLRRDDAALASVIERELERKGQVFWVHNRVQGLERVAEYVQKLAPRARLGIAHGQMQEKSLEENMHKFWHGELDILVCTAIVESGLDFPLANTLVVDQAQQFGMGQLYQLRGRVGRGDRQAYAYFIVPDAERLNERAGERLRVIQDMDYLGAGFQLAMEDLRLRGAGNILGEVQSGHMGRVGLELYLEMLEECVARLKGDSRGQIVETEITLGLPAHIPASYVEDSHERLRFYKVLTSAQDGAGREEITLALKDRFGPLPEELENFLAVLDLKQFLGQLQVARTEVRRDSLRLTWADGQTAVQPERLVALAAKTPGARLHPPSGLTLPLPGGAFAEGLRALRDTLEKTRAGGIPKSETA
ncbi:MAG: transcription-repair coupling factor [Desulfovibrio sp.]|jgi:transcription-repair coupling factor (superfamily II helicase)|nr:transcription-repair coupling factor [Desulfovibrio sp.]